MNTLKLKMTLITMTLVLSAASANAAAGGSDAPAVGSPLTKISRDESTKLFESMENFEQSRFFAFDVKTPSGNEKLSVTALLAGRYEPDAPVPTHVLIVRGDDYSTLFEVAPIIVQEVRKAGNQITISGLGGYWYDVDQCKGWRYVHRELVIEVSAVQNSYEPALRYSKVTDRESCNYEK